jgi:hypothetical protein
MVLLYFEFPFVFPSRISQVHRKKHFTKGAWEATSRLALGNRCFVVTVHNHQCLNLLVHSLPV